MASVSINPPKTPVTKGSLSIAKATLPNMCKMPGPPAPFVPTPLPNIGKSSDSPSGYSTSVKIEGNAVAIKGATFKSMGDIASKALGGGLLSMNTHGPTKFIGLGSLDVKVEGKNVQLLGDPMLNNCGPSGSPPNSATLGGVKHRSGAKSKLSQKAKCAQLKAKYGIDLGSHKDNTSGKTKKATRSYQSHHVIQDAAIKAYCPRSEALAIMLSNSHRGTEHGTITANQNARKANKARGGAGGPATTFGGLKKQARDDMIKGLQGRRKNKQTRRVMPPKDAKALADCIVAEAAAVAKKNAQDLKGKKLNDNSKVARPGGCFAAGTPVQLANGELRCVERLQFGDWLRTPSGVAQLTRIEPCRHTLVELVIGESVLTLADYHRLVDDDGFLVCAGDLCVGDVVATLTGPREVARVRAIDAPTLVYRIGLSDGSACLLGPDAVIASGSSAGPPLVRTARVVEFSEGSV